MQTGLDVFDRTIQKSLPWIDEVAEELHIDRHSGYRVLRAVLHVLRDRLPAVGAVDLAAQMPLLIRGMYYEGWNPVGKPIKMKRKEELYERIEREIIPPTGAPADIPPGFIEQAVDAVLHVLDRHISEGEMEHVRQSLPRSIRDLWGSD